MILHLIQRSPYSHSVLKDCLAVLGDQDAILLMEDGVYGYEHADLNEVNVVYALQPDLQARGLTPADDSKIQACDYDEFVSLSAKYSQVISWF